MASIQIEAEFLNTPIQNYSQMETIFAWGLATGKHAMGSSDSLGSPMPTPEYLDTQESEIIILDGPDKAGAMITVLLLRGRGRGAA